VFTFPLHVGVGVGIGVEKTKADTHFILTKWVGVHIFLSLNNLGLVLDLDVSLVSRLRAFPWQQTAIKQVSSGIEADDDNIFRQRLLSEALFHLGDGYS
jgi:hypothetical protein